MSNRVYSYGAKAPSMLKDVEDRLFEGNQYYNKLVEIERSRRAANDAVLMQYDPELPAMERAIEALDARMEDEGKSIKAANQREGRKKRDSVLSKLRAERKELKKEVVARKKALRQVSYGPEIWALEEKYKALTDGPNSKRRAKMKAELQQMKMEFGGYESEVAKNNFEAEKRKKELYSESRLTWYHKNDIMEAFKAACKKHPKFHRYDGQGRLYTQIQGGLSCCDVFKENPWFYITGSGRHRTAHLRIDSNGRNPVYTSVPFIMHRPLPEGTIKGVSLVRTRCATKTSWKLQINIAGAVIAPSSPSYPDECVSVDLGWRGKDGGRKIAHIVGSDGHEEILEIEARFLARWSKVEDLQAIRDSKFNEAVKVLRGWLKSHDVPDWLAESTSHIHSWNSPRRLAALVLRWRRNRFDGDTAIFHFLDGSPEDCEARKHNIKHWNGWRCWDKHLYEWQENLRQKAIRWRLDTYRKLAARLSRQYGTVIMEDTDWSQTMRRADSEDESNDIVKAGQRIASPGLLRKCLEAKFQSSLRVAAAGTTAVCSSCGEHNEIGAKSTYKCSKCGLTIDRDHNACLNLLSRGSVMEKTP